jgi:hypothetical protein
MANLGKTYDVFVSHSAGDAKLAADIVRACRASGLEAVASAEVMQGKNASKALREALAECQAMIVVLSSSELTSLMAIEIGAVRVWDKPIFGILTNLSITGPPSGLAGIRLYPSGRIEDVISTIKSSEQELSEEDRSLLADLYRKTGVPVDQLTLDADRLDYFVRDFHKTTGKSVPAERLVSELLRMRKRGQLSNGGAAKHAKARQEIA